MELLTGSELATKTGIAWSTLSKYVKQGRIPTIQDPAYKRPRFDAEAALEAVKALDIKPRNKRDAEEQVETRVEAASEFDINQVITAALRAAHRTFQRKIKSALEGVDIDTDLELTLMRMHAHSDAVFDTVREELLS